MISSEVEAAILHHFKSDKWPLGTIAKVMRVHYGVVRRVVEKDSGAVVFRRPVPSILLPFQPYIAETLEKYPHICASRVYQMIKERGFSGSEGHVRRNLQKLRPRKNKEAFLRLHMLPGEQAQADWAEFGKVRVGRAQRRLMGFVIVLSWSRSVYVRFFYSARMREFLQGFVDGFSFFEGVPRTVLHDNLRSGVTERVGPLIRFNDRFLKFAGHYGFKPDAANIRRGNEKGRVERSIQYIRTSFFEGREWQTLDDLNAQALAWCIDVAGNRGWREDARKTVNEALLEERPKLLALPATHFPTEERALVAVGKTPYARFDLNDYSVPPSCVGSNVQVVADDKTVKIFVGIEEAASHARSFDKGALVENPAHIKDVIQRKRNGKRPSALKRLVSLIPESEHFIQEMAKHQQSIGGVVTSLTNLMNIHGEKRLQAAITEAIGSSSYRLQTIHFILGKLEAFDKTPPPVPMGFDESKPFAHIVIKHHELSHYDDIAGVKNDTKQPS